MTLEELTAGDVVVLKSGGPPMTVEQVGRAAMTNRPTVWVSWFVGTKKMSDTFSPEALQKA